MKTHDAWIWALTALFSRRLGLSVVEFGGLPDLDLYADHARSLLKAEFGIEDAAVFDEALNQLLAKAADAPLVAYAGASSIACAGLGYVACFAKREAVSGRVHDAARRVRAAYSSFADFGHHYILGRALATDAFDAGDEQRALALLQDPDSPWRRLEWQAYPPEAPPAWVGVQVSVLCERCGHFSGIYRIARDHTCTQCLAPLTLDATFWTERVQRTLLETLDRGPDFEDSTRGFDSDVQHNLRLRRGLPPGENTVALPSEFVREAMPQVARLVGEQADLTLAYRQQPFEHAISVSCDACGAPLTLERVERHVRCGHCNATSELGEAVWRRLLPIAVPPFIYALLTA